MLREERPAADGASSAVEETAGILDIAYLDDLKESIGADGVRDIARKFIGTLDPQIAELALLQSVNGERYAKAAHKIASAAFGLGLMGLGNLLREIENAALANDRKTVDHLARQVADAARKGKDRLIRTVGA